MVALISPLPAQTSSFMPNNFNNVQFKVLTQTESVYGRASDTHIHILMHTQTHKKSSHLHFLERRVGEVKEVFLIFTSSIKI